MSPQKKRPTSPRKPETTAAPRRRPEYIAAVRYPDGRRDLFHVRNADDLDDARALVISEVGDVAALVISQRG